MSLLELHDVRKFYRTRGDHVVALDGVSLRVDPGEVVLLVGPSGSGKTTLLSVMGCILRPCEGRVLVGGVDAARLGEGRLPGLRARHFGYVFQQYNLFLALTARENVEAASEMKFGHVPRARDEAGRLLELVGLASRSNHKPEALSGGECQRVSIARALVGNPSIILADEPTAALDSDNAMQVMDLLLRLTREDGRSVVLVSHDHRLEDYADRTLRLEDGRLSSSDGARDPRQTASPNVVDINARSPLDRRERRSEGAVRGPWPYPRGESPKLPYPSGVVPRRPDALPTEESTRASLPSTTRSLSMSSPSPRMASSVAGPSAGRLAVLIGILLVCVAVECGVHARAYLGETRAPEASLQTVSETAGRSTPLTALGLVEAREGMVNLFVGAAGVLAKVHVDEGDWFEKDQVLAELANEELAARVEVARHDMAQSQARLELLLAGPRQQQIDEARADVEAIGVTAAHLERQQRTRQRLLERKAAAVEEVLDLQSRAETAGKQKEAAEARLNLLLAGSRPEEIAMARAAVRLTQARLREAIAALEHSRLKAPKAGRVLRVWRRAGEAVAGTETSPVLLVADTCQLQVRAEVEQSQASSLRVGLPVTASVAGLPGRTYKGTIARILDLMGRKQIHTEDPFERADSRVLEVIVSLEDAGQLRINQRVDAMIGTGACVPDPPADRASNRKSPRSR